MTPQECLRGMLHPESGVTYQHAVNQFIDDFRRAGADERATILSQSIDETGSFAALLAAVAECLTVETGMRPPAWTRDKTSPTPFFAFQAKSFALRARLMIESPPAFKMRRLFVPENYMSRA